jgi:MTH538 TIR-like domain (DUF1863)
MIPVVVGGGLLLHNLINRNKDEDIDEDEVIANGGEKIEYRRIYICHSYYDSSSYNKLAKKLKMTEDFKVFNHSIPISKKRDTKDKEELREVFRQQMAGCSHVFVLASPDLPRKSYVKIELEVAKELGKEVIAVTDRYQYSIPPFIKKLSDKIVTNDTRNLKKQLKK